MNRKDSKTIVLVLFSLLDAGQNTCCLIVRSLPYLFVCLFEILCTILLFIYHIVWCDRQGISIVGTSHTRTLRVVLVYHKVMYTKALPVTNNLSFHIESKKWSVYNFSISISDRISIWCAQPATPPITSWKIWAGWAPFDDPVASRHAKLSCCLHGVVVVYYFGIQP